jgi:serine protease
MRPGVDNRAMRRTDPVTRAGVALCTLVLAGFCNLSSAASAVNGLIVQLRDAPTHAALAHERALGAAPAAAGAATQHERGRWDGVLSQVHAGTAGVRVAERRAVLGSAQLLRFERPLSAAQAQAVAAQVAQRPEVLWAAPNIRERRLAPAGSPPSDPLYGGFDNQWWLQRASGSDAVAIDRRLRGAPDFLTAWTSVTTGSANSLVAVLDSGITSHPDLVGKVVAGYDMVSDRAFSNDGDGRDGDPTDPGDWVDSSDLARPEYDGCSPESSSWHGTAIAGMLAAQVNNGQGGASINWPGRVLVVRVAAKCGADVADIVDGMRWAAGLQVCKRSDGNGVCQEMAPLNPNPARVLNISFGGTGSCEPYQDTINELRALPNGGALVIAAAGNEHVATPTRPARCPGVFGVAALNRDGFKSTYSNFGSSVDIATVGGDDAGADGGRWGSLLADSGLLSVGDTGDTGPASSNYFYYYGTSFSTPIVAGAAGLMLSVRPTLTASQLEQGLRVSARPHVTSTLGGNVAVCGDTNPGRCLCTTSTCGAGILDVPQALVYAASPGSYTAPNWPSVVNNSAELQAAAALGPDRPANANEPPPSNGGGDGDGGGGAMSAGWLLALAAAGLALARQRRR